MKRKQLSKHVKLAKQASKEMQQDKQINPHIWTVDPVVAEILKKMLKGGV